MWFWPQITRHKSKIQSKKPENAKYYGWGKQIQTRGSRTFCSWEAVGGIEGGDILLLGIISRFKTNLSKICYWVHFNYFVNGGNKHSFQQWFKDYNKTYWVQEVNNKFRLIKYLIDILVCFEVPKTYSRRFNLIYNAMATNLFRKNRCKIKWFNGCSSGCSVLSPLGINLLHFYDWEKESSWLVK